MPIGTPATLYDHSSGADFLDGAVVDAEGLIWNARWGGGCVDVYTPEGERVRSLRVPAGQSSCPAFVGKRLRPLLSPSAWKAWTSRRGRPIRTIGRTFILEAGAVGRPEARLRLA